MTPTVDRFQALTRSAPWRSRTLHFTYATGNGAIPEGRSYDECWLRRPDTLVVVGADGRRHRLRDTSGGASSATVFLAVGDPRPSAAEIAELTRPPEPTFRSDGLAEPRPLALFSVFDVPMWTNYYFVAALDPAELGEGVRVERLREDTVAGRSVWRADLTPEPGYEPRCGGNCCELLWSEVSWHSDCDEHATNPDVTDPGVTDREAADHGPNCQPVPAGTVFPDHYDVAIDVQTGIVVRSLPVGPSGDRAPWLMIDILEVDADLDDVLASVVDDEEGPDR